MTFNDFLNDKISARRENGLLRSLGAANPLPKDFASNDYLGLAHSSELQKRIHEQIEIKGLHKNGATGSRLLSGNFAYAEEVEQKLASLFKGESCLIFNSGYSANLSVLSSLPQKGDTILYDEWAHACIKDGARLSLAKRFSFKHNDLHDLENKLKKAEGRIYVAVESIYSMDGDACPLSELVKVTEPYHAVIILDEAHSTGVYGENGNGLANAFGLENKIDIRVYTFGKGMGVHGACVVGSKSLIDYLINFARPFIYTTALPPHALASIDCAFEFLKDNISLQKILIEKVNTYKSALNRQHYLSNSAIQPFVVSGNKNIRKVTDQIRAHGFDVRPILSPTVKEGTERIRICLHTFNSNEDIIELSNLLQQVTNS